MSRTEILARIAEVESALRMRGNDRARAGLAREMIRLNEALTAS